MPAKTNKKPFLQDGTFNVKQVVELNSFDLTGERNKTKNTSNKSYHAELQVAKTGDKAQIYTMWGPTGGTQTKDWRHYDSEAAALKDFNSIIKSKKRKGYQEIDVAQRAYGSDEAKSITKAVQLANVAPSQVKDTCTLHKETQRLIGDLMGATNQFVITTLKCPLGQLTNTQIDIGRDKLKQAQDVLKKRLSSTDKQNQLLALTNDFYSAIPHNLGSGARGKMTDLILDTEDKINKKEYDLDTLLDAKAIGATLQSNSVTDQYNSLDTSFNFIDKQDPLFKWLNSMIQDTRASNHHYLGKIVLLNAWEVQRNNERDSFLKTATKIAGECGKQVIPDKMKSLVRNRTDIDDKKLFTNANVIPLFHGTRTQNITGILKKGILIRPSGVVITGAMYGSSAMYMASNSSKSINYTNIKASYWAKGNDEKAFLFISDCALGNQLLANGPHQYTLNNIQPKHSVWAQSGKSGVINDEMMLYRTDQHNLRYLLEFTCK